MDSPDTRDQAARKPVVIGLYGVSGCGKTTLLQELKKKLGEENFAYYEGSEVIAQVTPGGLESFKSLHKDEQPRYRKRAINTIKEQCMTTGKTGVVTGHFSFCAEGPLERDWNDKPDEFKAGEPVLTPNDWETYSHVIYLWLPAEVIAERIQNDTVRQREVLAFDTLRRWQQHEIDQLRSSCRSYGILFNVVFAEHPSLAGKVSTMLLDFSIHDEEHNLARATQRLDELLTTQPGLETVLVFDGDKTLSDSDTGALFWESKGVLPKHIVPEGEYPLETLFSGPLQYSYAAFRQAMLLYEDCADDNEFGKLCKQVAAKVAIYPELLQLIWDVKHKEHIGIIVMTCGLRRVWEEIIKLYDLSDKVKVIGGGRLRDGFIVTGDVKAALVRHLQDSYHAHVIAFGDSPLDLPMLAQANEAIVVVGEESTRSKTMDAELSHAITIEGLVARQVLIPENVKPRLSTDDLPVLRLSDRGFLDSILRSRCDAIASATLAELGAPTTTGGNTTDGGGWNWTSEDPLPAVPKTSGETTAVAYSASGKAHPAPHPATGGDTTTDGPATSTSAHPAHDGTRLKDPTPSLTIIDSDVASNVSPTVPNGPSPPLESHTPHPSLKIHLSHPAASNILSTPTRDSRVSGVALRAAHHNIGRHLALTSLTTILGLEAHEIDHVQGQKTLGHRLKDEDRTTIVAIMRGGEPMALGVSEAFANGKLDGGGMFVHAKEAGDLKAGHVTGQKAVVLVDSVVNSGKSLAEFVRRVRELSRASRGNEGEEVRIVCVAGVVQSGALMKGSVLWDAVMEGQAEGEGQKVDLVALRVSDNKFVGKGGTDTGNRLFGTVTLD